MLTYARWVVLLIAMAAFTNIGLRERRADLLLAGIVGSLICLFGLIMDYFRDRDGRTEKEELDIYRRTDAHRRRLNQRGSR